MQIILQIPTESIKAIARVLTADTTGTGYNEADGAARDKILRAIVTQAYFPNCFHDPDLAACIEADRREFARHIRNRRMPQSKRTVV